MAMVTWRPRTTGRLRERPARPPSQLSTELCVWTSATRRSAMRRRRATRAGRSKALRMRTATAAAAATTAAAVAAAGAGRLRALDLDGPAVDRRAVELADRLLGVFRRRHLDEAEAARAAGVAVGHHRRRLDIAGRGEDLAQ